MNDRIERFGKIRTWLDGCYAQRPSPHQILMQMLVSEQTLNLRLTNSRQPFNLISTTLTTVAGQDTYPITQPVTAHQSSGKVHFVVRATGQPEAPQIPIEFDDFSELNYGQMPQAGIVNAFVIAPEKISFYRAGMQDQVINAVIQPTPQEALIYTIWFFAGALDRAQSPLASQGLLPELSDYLDMKATMSLLPYAVWRDDDAYNSSKRKEIAASLMLQTGELEPIVETYIKNINAPKSFDMGHWNDWPV